MRAELQLPPMSPGGKDRTPSSDQHQRVFSHSAEMYMYLPGRVSTIYPQIGPRHKAARVAQQEHDGSPVLVCTAQSHHHVLTAPLPVHFLVLQHFGRQSRPDIPRRYGIDPDKWVALVTAPLGRQRPCQLHHRCLRRVVRRRVGTLP